MTARPQLLLIGSGEAAFREYALRAVAAKADVILAGKSALTWEKPYCTGSIVLDIDDFPAALEALKAFADKNVDGVLTYDERYVELTAQLTERLGLIGPSHAAVRAVKDKSRLRELLMRNGVGPVEFGVADTVEQARELVGRIGLPVVFKPKALGGSAGVRRVDRMDEIEAAFADAVGARVGVVRSRYDGVLIEEYLDGQEFSVDAVTYRGRTTPMVAAEKRTGLDPYFEEIGHVVPPGPGWNLSDEVVELLQRAHELAGLDNLVTHTELRLTDRGPRIIELNARLGGDLIPYLGLLAHGVDLAGAAADIALGTAPSTERAELGTAAVQFLYPTEDLQLRSIGLAKPISEYAGLDTFVGLCEPEEKLFLPPRGFMSRMAAVVCHGSSRQNCLSALADCVQDVVVDALSLGVGAGA